MADEEVIEEVAPDEEEDRHELTPEERARREAALRHIRTFGDPVLRAKARPVERFDDGLLEEVARMGRLMHDAIGIGRGATQVGTLHRLLVYRVQHESPIVALINPVIEWRGEGGEMMGGGGPSRRPVA